MNQGIIKLNKHDNKDGHLVVIEKILDIRRVFYIYGVGDGKSRGNHACSDSDFMYIAINGSFMVELTSRENKTQSYFLDTRDKGLFVPRNTWIKVYDFSAHSILLVISNNIYNKEKYINEFSEFICDIN